MIMWRQDWLRQWEVLILLSSINKGPSLQSIFTFKVDNLNRLLPNYNICAEINLYSTRIIMYWFHFWNSFYWDQKHRPHHRLLIWIYNAFKCPILLLPGKTELQVLKSNHTLKNWSIVNNHTIIWKLYLTLCMLGNFSCFCCHLPTFFKCNFLKNTIRVSNSLNPDQDQHFVSPDLGPNCLQRISADDKSSDQQGKS